MQNDIENTLNEIASKDSQVLCREVPYLAFKTYFLQLLLPNLWASVRVQLKCNAKAVESVITSCGAPSSR